MIALLEHNLSHRLYQRKGIDGDVIGNEEQAIIVGIILYDFESVIQSTRKEIIGGTNILGVFTAAFWWRTVIENG